jgi:hypothetical protein
MSQRNSRKRHQHTVQRAYLRSFADNVGRVRRVPLDGEPRIIHISDAAVVKEFYTIRQPDGSADRSYEDHLDHSYERGFIAARTALMESEPPWPSAARDIVARWIGVQFYRTPASRGLLGELSDWKLRQELGGLK